MLTGSLDRSVDVAATLELRGYGLDARPTSRKARRRPGELALALSGLAIAAVALWAGLSDVGGLEAYPTVAMDLDARTILFALSLPVLALAPFLLPSARSNEAGHG